MPAVKKGESKSDYISRCVPVVLDEGVTSADGKHRDVSDNDEAVAICASMYDEAKTASEMVRDYIVGEFRGDYPQVAIDARVDLETLTAGDEKPFFLTLPVGEVGKVSANGLRYDEELVKDIEAQLVGRGGIMGHIKLEERSTAFPVEDVDWVGVARAGNTLWGKAYVPPGEVREYVRRLKGRGGQLATSIYGPYEQREPLQDGTHRIRGLRLESVDLAPADRAALKLGGAFAVTAQMEDPENEDSEDDMALTKEQVIAELTVDEIPAALREAIVKEVKASLDADKRVAELQQQLSDKDTLIGTLQADLQAKRMAEFDAALDAKVAELVDWKVEGDDARAKVEAFRRTVRVRIVSELGEERTAEKLAGAAEKAWAELKPLAEMIRDALAGPSARVSGRVADRHKLDDSPEARRKARAEMGL